MITMEILGKIRRMYLRDKLSMPEITKQPGLSRNTIRTCLRSSEKAAPQTYRRTEGSGKLSAFHNALERALNADGQRAKRDRRTTRTCSHKSRPMVMRVAIAVSPTSSAPGAEEKARRRTCSYP